MVRIVALATPADNGHVFQLMQIQNGPKTLGPHRSLWRYVRLPQLLLLLEGRLSLASIFTLRRHDPLEGRGKWDQIVQTAGFSDAEYRPLVDFIKTRRLSPSARRCFESNAVAGNYDQRLIFEHWSEIILSTRYALSFFLSDHESIAMWRQYAPDGVAIKTSLTRLNKALSKTNRPWRISQMIYKDLSQEITGDDACNDPDIPTVLRRPFLLKQKEYSGEKEVRLFTVDPEARPHLTIENVRPESWIEEVRISPDAWLGDADAIRKLVVSQCKGLKGLVHHSPIRAESAFGERNI